MRRTQVLIAAVLLLGVAFSLVSREPQHDPRLKNAFRRPEHNGWIFVHLEGAPSEMGFQHGYLLAPEIQDTFRAVALEMTHGGKEWKFFRKAAQDILWPKIETEYREELQGITDGVKVKGVKMDLWDVVALNAS